MSMAFHVFLVEFCLWVCNYILNIMCLVLKIQFFYQQGVPWSGKSSFILRGFEASRVRARGVESSLLGSILFSKWDFPMRIRI